MSTRVTLIAGTEEPADLLAELHAVRRSVCRALRTIADERRQGAAIPASLARDEVKLLRAARHLDRLIPEVEARRAGVSP